MKKIFVITAEESADMHSKLLFSQLKEYFPFELYGSGGENLSSIGCEIIYPIEQLSVIGFWEALRKLPEIARFKRTLIEKIKKIEPDIVFLVDYPGFNISFLKWLKRNSYKTCYFILPQVWAWNEKRKYILMKYADLLLSIIPFEKKIFGDKTVYLGNPIVNKINDNLKYNEIKKEYFGIFPGSRISEVGYNLPVMLDIARHFKDAKFIMDIPSHLSELIKKHDLDGLDIEIRYNTYIESVSKCYYALISSGTATLEAALIGIPATIIYNVNTLTYTIAKQLIKIDHIGLPNILLKKEMYREFIQNKKIGSIYDHIKSEMEDIDHLNNISEYSAELNKMLGKFSVEDNIAKRISALMEDENV